MMTIRFILLKPLLLNKRAIDKALSRLYVKLRFQGIDPNSVKLKHINGDEK